MGAKYLIDTNAVIDYLDGKLPSSGNNLLDDNNVNISVITRMELLSWSGSLEKQTEILEEFISLSQVFNLSESIIQKTIKVRKAFATKLPDAIIAATALTHDFTLITRNTKDFNKIAGLNVVNPHNVE